MKPFMFCLLVLSVVIAGCGGGGGSSQISEPVTRSAIELTPAGTGEDFILVGETGIYFNSVPAAVQTPTLLQFTRFPTPIGLAAPIPAGFGFIGAADIEQVDSPRRPLALSAPVILRIPTTRSLPEGRRLLILIADNTDNVPVFRPLLTSTGEQAVANMRPDGSAEFSTDRFGTFALVSSL